MKEFLLGRRSHTLHQHYHNDPNPGKKREPTLLMMLAGLLGGIKVVTLSPYH